MDQVMNLDFTRESHRCRYNRLLSYNLPQEMDVLKYVLSHTWHTLTRDTHTHAYQCYITHCTEHLFSLSTTELNTCMCWKLQWIRTSVFFFFFSHSFWSTVISTILSQRQRVSHHIISLWTGVFFSLQVSARLHPFSCRLLSQRLSGRSVMWNPHRPRPLMFLK